MCCILTYLSWTIDFIQRVWTFLMTCCIGCTVCILLFVASMAGIAFGYNYSVSEFLRVEGSQKYVIVTRHLFANKTGDKDIQQNSTKEHVTNNNKTNLSGKLIKRFMPLSHALETEDQIKYANSLSSSDTWDLELDEIINNFPSGSVDQMKAILNHIYLRKSRKFFNKTTKKFVSMPTEISTKKITFAAYDETKLKNLQENNQGNENQYPTGNSDYLTLIDVTQKQLKNSTFDDKI